MTRLPLETHLMISDPDFFLDAFAAAGSDSFLVHWEGNNKLATVKARVAIEQASTVGWERYVGTSGAVIGMKTFGASAPLKELPRRFGFEPDQVVAPAKAQLGRA